MLKTFHDKNVDYGNSFEEDGIVGTVIRIGDKLKRLKTISEKGHVVRITDEKLLDTLMDLANYAAMGVMLLREEEADEEVDGSGDKQVELQQIKKCVIPLKFRCPICSPSGE
jgi:hypothetical protein